MVLVHPRRPRSDGKHETPAQNPDPGEGERCPEIEFHHSRPWRWRACWRYGWAAHLTDTRLRSVRPAGRLGTPRPPPEFGSQRPAFQLHRGPRQQRMGSCGPLNRDEVRSGSANAMDVLPARAIAQPRTDSIPVAGGEGVMAVELFSPDASTHLVCLLGAPMSGVPEIAAELGRRYEPSEPVVGADLGAWRWVASCPMISFEAGPLPSTVVVMPNVPATERDVRLLTVVARTCGLPLTMLELTADDLDLARRAFQRWRSNCTLSPSTEVAAECGSQGCTSCGGVDATLPVRHQAAFLRDLDGYRRRIIGLRQEAARLDLAWISLPAPDDLHERVAAVREAIEHLIVPADALPPAARMLGRRNAAAAFLEPASLVSASDTGDASSHRRSLTRGRFLGSAIRGHRGSVRGE